MTIEATPRTEKGKKLKALRAEGVLPGVVYGPKEEAIAFSISAKNFAKTYAEAGESTILTLKGLGADKDVLVHDVSYDAVSGDLIHVDLYAVEAGKTLQVHVELEFVGDAPALKLGSVVLTKVLHEIEVECMPRDLPSHITVDVSVLSELDSAIHVKDLPKLTGVEYLAEPEDVVVIASSVAEEAETPTEAVDMTAIGVEKKGKKEEEEAGA